MQRQHAVRRNRTNTVREGEIVGELRTDAFLTGNHAGLDHAAFTQALEELFAQHRVGESTVNQNRTGTVEGFFGAVNLQGFVCLSGLNALVFILFGAVGNVRGGNGVCLGEGHLQQVFDEGIKPGGTRHLGAGHTLAAVRGVDGVHVCDGGGVHERGTQLQQGERVDEAFVGAFGERFEHAVAALFEGAELAQARLDGAQLGVGECTRCFFAVAGDEGYGVVGVEQRHGCADAVRRDAGFYGERVDEVLGGLLSLAAGFVFFAVCGAAEFIAGGAAGRGVCSSIRARADAAREGVFAHPSSFAYFAAAHGLAGNAEKRVSAGRILLACAGAGKRIFLSHLLVQITSLYAHFALWVR